MLTINITPTTLAFKHLDDEMFKKLKYEEKLDLEYSEKGYFFIKGTEKELYKTLLKLAYTYDIELV